MEDKIPMLAPYKENICTSRLMERIRERLELTKKQLPDAHIKKVATLSNKLILNWMIENADGFSIKDNGILIISKYMPKYLRGDKEEVIERINKNSLLKEEHKQTLIKRYQKSIIDYKKFEGDDLEGFNINHHSFFYIFRAMWFNQRNTAFKKAEIYKFKHSKDLKERLSKAIKEEDRNYYEWQFSDFFETKLQRSEEKMKEKTRRKKKKKTNE